ncbi:hypothetical protein QEN19_004000 [Hanseniaspora menglaensis]
MSHTNRHNSLDLLPLSNINSHDSIESFPVDEEDNPYLISIGKKEKDANLQTLTPHNTPRDQENIDFDILNNKLSRLARITSVNSSYFSDYKSITPASKNSSTNQLYNIDTNTSSGNTSKQVSNVNLKKMMAMSSHNPNTKYKLSNAKIQSSYTDLMDIHAPSLLTNQALRTNIRNKHKFKLHLVTSRESDDDYSEEEEEEEKLTFPKYNSEPIATKEHKVSGFSHLSNELKSNLNAENGPSDTESNFSMVSSLEPKSPKSPMNHIHSTYQPTVSSLPEQPSASPNYIDSSTPQEKIKYVFILSGLPASGKSTLSQNMIQYMTNTYLTSKPDSNPESLIDSVNGMNISGFKKRRNSIIEAYSDPKRFKIEIFNAGKIRRSDSYNRTKKMYLMANNSNEDLFSPKNKSKKDVFAKLTLDSLFKNLGSDGLDMAIFDATNSTRERRQFVVEEIAKQQREMKKKKSFETDDPVELKIIPVFLQIMCTNKEFMRYNIYNKSFNDDYFDKPFDFAIQDFSKRVLYYSQQYCPITQEEIHHLQGVMKEIGFSSNLYYINLENSSDSSYESNIGEEDSYKDGILAGLLDFAIKYNSLPESIAYVNNVKNMLDTIEPWNLDVLETTLDEEYFKKLNKNLQRTCTRYGVKVPLIK